MKKTGFERKCQSCQVFLKSRSTIDHCKRCAIRIRLKNKVPKPSVVCEESKCYNSCCPVNASPAVKACNEPQTKWTSLEREAKRTKYHPLIGRLGNEYCTPVFSVSEDDTSATAVNTDDDISEVDDYYLANKFSLDEDVSTDESLDVSACSELTSREDDMDSWNEDEELSEEESHCGNDEEGNMMFINEAVNAPNLRTVSTRNTSVRINVRMCRNCRRTEGNRSSVKEYNVELCDVKAEDLACHTKWKTFVKAELGRNELSVLLCQNCRVLLNKGKDVEKTKWYNIWPVYMWMLMSNDDIIQRYGGNILRFVPVEWHEFWIEALVGLNAEIFDSDTIAKYAKDLPVTVDVTKQRNMFKNIIKDNRLGKLKHGCNTYLIPRVLCPWGCTSYDFHDGFVSMDAIFGVTFPFFQSVGKMKTTETRKCLSTRQDFFSDMIDAWYYNEDWTVHPSVCYQRNVGPVFLTCKDHHKGTYQQYFHLPRTGITLPSRQPDSLSHAVLRSRTLKPCQPRAYSHSFQLNKCVASYGGVDTCLVSEKRNFDFQSHLTDHTEARAFGGRIDIRALADRLVDIGTVSQSFRDNLTERHEALYDDSSLERKMSEAATMMTLHDTIKLQEMIATPQTIKIRHEEKEMMINRIWPHHLIMLHPNDNHGGWFHNFGISTLARTEVDLRLVWMVANATLCLPHVWNTISCLVSSSECWHGFLLNFLNRKILHRALPTTKKTNNPFHIKVSDQRMKPSGFHRMFTDIIPGVNENSRFNAEHLLHVFREAIDKGIINAVKLRDNSTGEVERVAKRATEKCQLIMVLRLRDKPTVRLRNNLGTGASSFELRFIGCTTERREYTTNKNKWDGRFYCRHGGALFDKWWGITRDGVTDKLDDLNESVWDEFDVALYAKRHNQTVHKYREDYLKYIGGQNRVYCDSHKLPLITSRNKKGKDVPKCTHATCECGRSNKQEFSCPIDFCGTGICKELFTSLSPDERTYISGSDTVTPSRRLASLAEEREGSAHEFICDQDPLSKSDVMDLPTGEENPVFDVENAHGDTSNETNDVALPTTHADSCPTEFDTTIGWIGSSVFLNKCGTMLVRKDNEVRASRKEKNLIERVVSAPNVGTVPLVYLEGVLFPSIFWCLPHPTEGGILGSMPTSLFCQHSTRKQYNIASVADHAKTRLKSISNVASMDNRYLSFQFDSLANGALEGHDTRVVLSRGFEECMGPAGMRMRNGEDDLYTDTIDSRQNVHNLCASERDEPSTLFVTLTCNQRDHFGTSPVKRYIDDGQALTNYKAYLAKHFPSEDPLTLLEEQEVQDSFIEASRNLICRNWLEVKTLILKYILNSEEKPLGDVIKIFCRDEYQCECGNLCHQHMLVTVRFGYNTKQGRKFIQSIIRGHVDEIVGIDEVEQFIAEGLLEDWHDYETMKDQARRILPHKCTPRCKRRTGTGEEDLTCRKPDTRKISHDLSKFFELNLDIVHDKQAVQIFEKLGMCKPLHETLGAFVPTEEFLKAKRIHAPARFGEGIISPVIGRLFAATRSSMNVQVCTSFGTSRYIVKYLIKIDEQNYVAFHVKRDDPNVVKAEHVFLHNTKITSSEIQERKKMEGSRHKARAKGRTLSATEMMQIILGYPQVFTNIEFLKVPSLPLGDRCGVEQRTPYEKDDQRNTQSTATSHKDVFDRITPMVSARTRFFTGKGTFARLHTTAQIRILEDQMHSAVSIDRVTLFGIRPPELLFIDKMEWYFRYFVRIKKSSLKSGIDCIALLSHALEKSPLIDGLGHEIRIRPQGIAELRNVLQSDYCKTKAIELDLKKMWKLLLTICEIGTTVTMQPERATRIWLKSWENYKNVFISGDRGKILPVVVFSNVRPRNASKFIIHLLLSMGHFYTEQDLWTQGNMRSALEKANLIPPSEGLSDLELQKSVDGLTDAWIRDQLQFYPVGTKKFDEYVVDARRIIECAVLHNSIAVNEMPPYLYSTLVSNCEEKVLKYRKDCKAILIEATLQSLQRVYGEQLKNFVPDKQALLDATKSKTIQWSEPFPKTTKQSNESHNEQSMIQQQMKRSIDGYINCLLRTPSNYLIAGPPGAGKTHCMNHGIIYSLSKGLYAMTTAVLADRAFLLGGQHFHKLFKLPVRDSRSPQRLAELGVISLQRRPQMLSLLRYLDVLFVDELGQLSAEMLSVLDILMRRIRDSSLFMGGVLVVGTLDQVQLRPIKGLPFLLSPYVLTTFALGTLCNYVRCAACPIAQEINEIARFFTSDRILWDQKLKRLELLLRENCTFITSWDDDDINDDVLRVFPKREQKDKAIHDFTMQKRELNRRQGIETYTVRADDVMVGLESHGDTIPASPSVVGYLNWKCDEPKELDLYKGGIYRFTCNQPGKYNATQLGMIIEEPNRDDLANFRDIPILVAPPGVKSVQVGNKTKEELILEGWKETSVGAAPEYTRSVWSQNVKARRKQYALSVSIASTIHSAIGHTVLKIATELCLGALWERAMVVVLLSRVATAPDIIFVGDKESNIRAIIAGLSARNQYDDYMNHVVKVLEGVTNPDGNSIPLRLPLHPYRPKDIPLPTDDSGFVYLLASAHDGASLYVGRTNSLPRRIKEHNSGMGALQTADPSKRPWALVAYVAGFGNNTSLMHAFEMQWQSSIGRLDALNVDAVLERGLVLINRNFSGERLLLVRGI